MGALGQEVAPFGIRTTIVNPGWFRTGLASPESLIWPDVVHRRLRRAQRRGANVVAGARRPTSPATRTSWPQALLTIAGEDPPPRRSSPAPT